MRARPRTTFAGQRCRRDERRRAHKDREIGRHAQRVRQAGAMERPSQRGVVAELGIADHRGEREARRADLTQRQRLLPFGGEGHRRRNPRAGALTGREPRLGQVQGGAQKPRPGTGPQRHGDRGLAVRDLAEGPAVLPPHPHRRRALLGEAGPVQNQDARALRDHRPQAPPHALGVPRGMRDEVLKRLIGAGIAEPCPHRLHRLAATVVEQARHIPTQRAPLALSTEVPLEGLQPGQQSAQPRGRGAIEHCASA